MIRIIILPITVLYLYLLNTCHGQCGYHQTIDSVKTYCTKEFGGVSEGSRCFFSPDGKYTWDEAWNVCAAKGGTLAQIHTDAEWSAIVDHLKIQYGLALSIWIGAKRFDPTGRNGDCAAPPQKTAWYDNATSPNLHLLAANTWLGKRCKFGWNAGYNCINILLISIDLIDVDDCDCAYQWNILCQYTGQSQNYTQTNTCLGQVPIEKFTAPNGVVQDCADACSKKDWCRSFNYVTSDGHVCISSCQLFSWSINDAPNTAVTPNCHHYNYIT